MPLPDMHDRASTPRQPPPADLRTRAIKSTGWLVASRLFLQAVSWSVTLVLARLLAPQDYGLYGMAIVIIGFLEVFQGFGLGAAIIQRQDLSREQINGMFCLSLLSGAALLGIMWALSGPMATFYQEPRLTSIVRALGFLFVIAAAGAIPSVLLAKEIDFRRRSLAEGAAVLPGAAVALALAYGGHGVWALVFGELTRATVRTSALFALSGWRPGLDISFRDARALLGFGSTVVGVTAIRELSPVLQTAVLGRLLGSQAVGLYSIALNLGMSPVHKISSAVMNALSLPVFSRLQGQTDRLRTAFLTVTRYIAIVSFPVQIGMAVVASDFVAVVLSAQWSSVVLPLQVMSVGALWNVILVPAPSLLTARGKVRLTLYLAIASTAIMPVALAAGAKFGMNGVAAAWGIAYCSLRSLLCTLTLREIDLPFGRYLRSIAPPALSAIAMAIAIFLARSIWPMPETAALRLTRDVAVGALVYPTVLLLLDWGIAAQTRAIWRTLIARAEV